MPSSEKTISEIIWLRSRLSCDITELITEFEKDSLLKVTGLNIERTPLHEPWGVLIEIDFFNFDEEIKRDIRGSPPHE